MSSYVFTEKAESDLEKIIDYTVEHWGYAQANQYVGGLEEVAQILADNPDIGMIRDDLSSELHSFLYERHILYYITDSYGVCIVRVLHASMDPAKHINK